MSASIEFEATRHVEGELQRRQTLAHFLRQRRERIQPEEIGLAVRRRRRAPGLLREEVADIAGVSTTWYTWLEQARPVRPSQQVLDGLATALSLKPEERTYMYRLARPDLHASTTGRSAALTPALHALLHGLAPHAAYAIDASWNVIDWNAPAVEIFGAFEGADRGNLLTRLLFDPYWRELFDEWEEIIERSVAQFRATTVSISSTPAHQQFVARLSQRSELFARLWSAGDVQHPPSCIKVLNHPQKGRCVYSYATLRPDGISSQVRFTIYTPAGGDASNNC
jgi:transcriptional regulator with XRE-family HTH domain